MNAAHQIRSTPVFRLSHLAAGLRRIFKRSTRPLTGSEYREERDFIAEMMSRNPEAFQCETDIETLAQLYRYR